MAFFEQNSLRFHCTGCGVCCGGGTDHYVYLEAGEAEVIRRHLGLSEAWFRRRYLRTDPGGEPVLDNAQGHCVFLRSDKGCRVYAARPLQCRTYPYWPETLRSRAAWRREGLRCEGIGQGEVIPVGRIRAILAKQKKVLAGK